MSNDKHSESIQRDEHAAAVQAKRVIQVGFNGINPIIPLDGGKEIIDVNGTTIYIGSAAPGTATSDSSWYIEKIDTNNPITILHSGNTAVWDNRASETYA